MLKKFMRVLSTPYASAMLANFATYLESRLIAKNQEGRQIRHLHSSVALQCKNHDELVYQGPSTAGLTVVRNALRAVVFFKTRQTVVLGH